MHWMEIQSLHQKVYKSLKCLCCELWHHKFQIPTLLDLQRRRKWWMHKGGDPRKYIHRLYLPFLASSSNKFDLDWWIQTVQKLLLPIHTKHMHITRHLIHSSGLSIIIYLEIVHLSVTWYITLYLLGLGLRTKMTFKKNITHYIMCHLCH